MAYSEGGEKTLYGESLSTGHPPTTRVLEGYRIHISKSLDGVIVRVGDGSSDGGISEDELAVIAIAIRMYTGIDRMNGNGFSRSNGQHHSSWLSNWIRETVSSSIYSSTPLLKRNGNGLNHRSPYPMLDDYSILEFNW